MRRRGKKKRLLPFAHAKSYKLAGVHAPGDTTPLRELDYGVVLVNSGHSGYNTPYLTTTAAKNNQ